MRFHRLRPVFVFCSVFVCAVSLFLFPAFAAAAQDAGRKLNPNDSKNKYALLIGINQYQDKDVLAPLRSPGNDAAGLQEQLDLLGFTTDIMTNDSKEDKNVPDKENIMEQIENLAKRADTHDLIFLMFTGHGMNIGGKAYLAARDSRVDKPETLVSVDKVMQILQTSRAKFKFCFMNACQEIVQPPPQNVGVLKGGVLKNEVLKNEPLQQDGGTDDVYSALMVPLPKNRSHAKGGGITRMFACAEGQMSRGGNRKEWNLPDEKMFGYYTHALIEGLKGHADEDENGTITFFELTRFATAEVQKIFQGKEFADRQDPNAMLDLTGDPVLAELPLNKMIKELLQEKMKRLRNIIEESRELSKEATFVFYGDADRDRAIIPKPRRREWNVKLTPVEEIAAAVSPVESLTKSIDQAEKLLQQGQSLSTLRAAAQELQDNAEANTARFLYAVVNGLQAKEKQTDCSREWKKLHDVLQQFRNDYLRLHEQFSLQKNKLPKSLLAVDAARQDKQFDKYFSKDCPSLAITGLGRIYGGRKKENIRVDRGIPYNPKEAYSLYRLAADLGCSEGLYYAGYCCYNGYGIAENKEEGRKLFQESADAGNAQGMFALGEDYYETYEHTGKSDFDALTRSMQYRTASEMTQYPPAREKMDDVRRDWIKTEKMRQQIEDMNKPTPSGNAAPRRRK
ncbi:MAG: caspase family protein [Planctomycetaceae bacterium]|jgi:TPR repeat protein|nr:caspase family protein [Planctomycetaceae bacterium]